MLKTFDIRVKSRFSENYYDAFVVDTKHNRVTFNQCDARRNGQVARYFMVTFDDVDGTADIYAESAEGRRKETFSRTQCLGIALRLLQEVRDEEKQKENVAKVSSGNKSFSDDDIMYILSILSVVIGLISIACGVTNLYTNGDPTITLGCLCLGALAFINAVKK